MDLSPDTSNSTYGEGVLPHFFVVKIKGEDETLEAWNFILKLFRPSFADFVKNLFGLSLARS